ncbi:hypothetical protein [Fervidobacterium thailandense]|uniref:Uncharacterized protein n=1 Tax=Fervidobacterium thailandense TaxID=1008305 RepID=A0A1E3G390_9BACT|nr:hypothetical protein [Fervidobacterium thailandense]ODN30735.1 hypothetical protein A4H02_04190 [Fervidobacterium thailandense]
MAKYWYSGYDDFEDDDIAGEEELILPRFPEGKKAVLACFGDEGYITVEVEDLFPIPKHWEPAFIQTNSWYIEPSKNLLRVPQPCIATFKVPTKVRVYYVFREGQLQQFVDISAPIEEAFVVVALRPMEPEFGDRILYAPGSFRSRDEVEEIEDVYGTNLYVLGDIVGLSKVASVKLKDIALKSETWNTGIIDPRSSNQWLPTSLKVRFKADDHDLPYGELFVVSNVSGKDVVIARTKLLPSKGIGEIIIPSSWSVFYKYEVLEIRENKALKETYIVGRISLKGSGNVKLVIEPRWIRDYGIRVLSIDPPTKYTELKDSVEMEFTNVSGETSYLIEIVCNGS